MKNTKTPIKTDKKTTKHRTNTPINTKQIKNTTN